MKSPRILINIDVEDLLIGETFYRNAFGLLPKRRLGDKVLELEHEGLLVYLLEKAPGSFPIQGCSDVEKHYDRHWTPVHLDLVVDDVKEALRRAEKAGAIRSKGSEIREHDWGKIVEISDPFGNGLCLLEFVGSGYDTLATAR